MSRSTKAPVAKDSNKQRKQQANRRLRRVVKIAVQTGQEILPNTSEITNDYEVCDWKIMADKNDSYYEKFKRK